VGAGQPKRKGPKNHGVASKPKKMNVHQHSDDAHHKQHKSEVDFVSYQDRSKLQGINGNYTSSNDRVLKQGGNKHKGNKKEYR